MYSGNSVKAILIREEYYRRGVFSWDNHKVATLCRKLGVTLKDLAAILGMFNGDESVDMKRIRIMWNTNYWPGYVGLTLTNLEQSLKEKRNG